jgi:hypothetical protein
MRPTSSSSTDSASRVLPRLDQHGRAHRDTGGQEVAAGSRATDVYSALHEVRIGSQNVDLGARPTPEPVATRPIQKQLGLLQPG